MSELPFASSLAALGVRADFHVLDVLPEELWRRLETRNRDLPPDTFPVTRAQLDEWTHRYEVPTGEERARPPAGQAVRDGSAGWTDGPFRALAQGALARGTCEAANNWA